jgi:ABC-2 type transport system ATP-binding protein
MTAPAIETEGLTKHFGDVVAVEDLDMTVERGEIYGFLGPNGAGKSTTINMLLDFLHPTSGSARVLGHDTRAESLAIRKRIGILPEGAELYPRLTGREHVAFVADTKDAEVDPKAMLDRVGLAPEDQTRQVEGYSKGMQQRLALGMALTGDPDLLILDEPSSGLDPNGMAEMREIIREAAAAGRTVFFSSHLLAEVEAVCDRVAILNEGRLVAEDTIENLREVSGVNPVVEIQCADVPDDLGLADLRGVLAVEQDGRWLSVTCRETDDKVAAIRHVDARASVTDVVAEETSLEALFESYTSDDADAGETPRGESTRAADPAEVRQ